MSQFSLENDLSRLAHIDAPLNRGPQMRWQRRALNESNNNSHFANCANANDSTASSAKNGGKIATPLRMRRESVSSAPLLAGQGASKTPGSQTKRNKTPGKSKLTPTALGDRFIPNRSSTQMELGHFLLTNRSNVISTSESEDSDKQEVLSPAKLEYQRIMNEKLNGQLLTSRILSYKNKAPPVPEGVQNNLKVLYSQTNTPGSRARTVRHIPQMPERILDAPDLLDDYYLNLIDWSSTNLLAVSLGNHVYLWNASNGSISQLLELEEPDDYVCSVSWIKDSYCLAVGSSTGQVEIWEIEPRKKLRTMSGHAARIGSLAWNNHILSSGSRSGAIHHHDVRVSAHHIGTSLGHVQEVCGLKWSPDGRHLASGGNDNLVNIWSLQSASSLTQPLPPVYTFSQHQAAVKGLAWCPWQSNLLASGGGTADRQIRFWNCSNGTCVNNIDTKSQVCALLWSAEHKELISSHGFANNQLVIWKYPSMARVAELTGHTSRVLHMAMSPDGTTVVSAAADETLRLWKCFAVDVQKQKSQKKSNVSTNGSGVLAMSRVLR